MAGEGVNTVAMKVNPTSVTRVFKASAASLLRLVILSRSNKIFMAAPNGSDERYVGGDLDKG